MNKFFKKLFQKHVKLEEPVQRINVEPEENCYRARVNCTNCGYEIALLIKKGIYIRYAVPTINCPHCGCKVDRQEQK